MEIFFRHQVLPVVLPELSAAGYRVVDVATCLGVPKYLKVSSPGQRDVSFTPPERRRRVTDLLSIVYLAMLMV